MTQQRDFLVEIGTEELPPKALKTLRDAFLANVMKGVDEATLSHGEAKAFASPRRLAVLIPALQTAQEDKTVQRRGPAVQAAFDDDGCPTKAAQGFAASCGVSVDDLETMETDKGAWLVYEMKQEGQSAQQLLPDIVAQALDKLPIPKRMRWGAGSAQFVRPVHWTIMLLGDQLIDAELLSVKTGNQTRGHRFHKPEFIQIPEAIDYDVLLETEGQVLVDFDKRREAVRAQVLQAAQELGGKAVIDEDLLDEVTGMVEWPQAIVGNFEERFLAVPAECLISAMKGHQKYFHVVDSQGTLLPHFITISNIVSEDPEKVREGNERVIRPRLSDAEFFWNQDRKRPLEKHIEGLKTVVFQNKLGTLYDKTLRVMPLASHIAEQLSSDAEQAKRAAELAKCDLMSEMVYEFPELQGIMGRYYAESSGESAAVAQALDEQYMPRFAGDEVPASATGQALALAERLDTLVGIFAIGQVPTGDKDPFALRRAALGALRIIIENKLDLNLWQLIKQAADSFDSQLKADNVSGQVFDFMMDRLRGYVLEQGYTIDTFEAVLARRPEFPTDFISRIQAVSEFRKLEAAESLAAANKRIHNILKKLDGDQPETVDDKLLVEDAEKALANKLSELQASVSPLLETGDYSEALEQLSQLRHTVDAFFDQVMVMAEDESLRHNRIALLTNLRNLFMRVADLSLLQN